MNRLATRKTRLALLTEATVHYRGRERHLIVEPGPHLVSVRLAGTRTRYEVSWQSVFNLGARIAGEKEWQERRRKRGTA